MSETRKNGVLARCGLTRVLRPAVLALVGCAASIQTAQAQVAQAPAVVRAQAEATLSAVMPGVIDELPFDEGAAFAGGDTLVALDCAIPRAEADAAQADFASADATYKSRSALADRGGIGRTEVAVAKAAADAAGARAKAAALRLRGCVVQAPFDGFVSEYSVNQYEYVEVSQPMVAIVSAQPPDIEIIAPSGWLGWITLETTGQLMLEATGQTYAITVSGIAATVDPVSRTVKLTAAFTDTAAEIRPGMSGLATFEGAP